VEGNIGLAAVVSQPDGDVAGLVHAEIAVAPVFDAIELGGLGGGPVFPFALGGFVGGVGRRNHGRKKRGFFRKRKGKSRSGENFTADLPPSGFSGRRTG
jgi:hypothetical protein